jgi:hypothetical protein
MTEVQNNLIIYFKQEKLEVSHKQTFVNISYGDINKSRVSKMLNKVVTKIITEESTS